MAEYRAKLALEIQELEKQQQHTAGEVQPTCPEI